MKRIFLTAAILSLTSQAILADDLPNKYCASPGGTYTQVQITNNCSGSPQLYAIMTNLTKGGADQGTIPTSGCNTLYIPEGYNAVIFTASPGDNPGNGINKTRFELTYANNNIVSWDVSANQGFDNGMTVTAPENTLGPTLLIAKNVYAPAAYPDSSKTNNQCTGVQPCYSNAWNNDKAASNTFNLYMCNRSTDTTNTPGVCGCNTCNGFICTQGSSQFCTTSGSGLYCLQPSSPQQPNQCNNDVKIKCNWTNDPSGGANCPASCPVTNQYTYG